MKSYRKSLKHIGLQTKLLSSCQAFSQSRRQTNVVTFFGKRAARVLLAMYPEELNSHSHGTDVRISGVNLSEILSNFNRLQKN